MNQRHLIVLSANEPALSSSARVTVFAAFADARAWRCEWEMRLLERLKALFGQRPAVGDTTALADFIDRHAAFIVQKGIFEYSRARAGHYAKVLFREEAFAEAVERARWSAYPLGLAMVGEMAEGVLRPYAGGRAWAHARQRDRGAAPAPRACRARPPGRPKAERDSDRTPTE